MTKRQRRRARNSHHRNRPMPWLAIALCLALAGCDPGADHRRQIYARMDAASQRAFFVECLKLTNGTTSDNIVRQCKDSAFEAEFDRAAGLITQPTGQAK